MKTEENFSVSAYRSQYSSVKAKFFEYADEMDKFEKMCFEYGPLSV